MSLRRQWKKLIDHDEVYKYKDKHFISSSIKFLFLLHVFGEKVQNFLEEQFMSIFEDFGDSQKMT